MKRPDLYQLEKLSQSLPWEIERDLILKYHDLAEQRSQKIKPIHIQVVFLRQLLVAKISKSNTFFANYGTAKAYSMISETDIIDIFMDYYNTLSDLEKTVYGVEDLG